MNRLEKAMARLNLALTMLEAKLTEGAVTSIIPAEVMDELSALRDEREALMQENSRLKDEARALEDFTDQVSGRIDGAIRNIQTVLQH